MEVVPPVVGLRVSHLSVRVFRSKVESWVSPVTDRDLHADRVTVNGRAGRVESCVRWTSCGGMVELGVSLGVVVVVVMVDSSPPFALAG